MTFQKVEADTKEVKEVKKKEIVQVVDKLPVQEVRRIESEDGTVINLITVAEALTQIINAGAE